MRRKYICTNGIVEVTDFVVGDKTEGGRKWHRAKSAEDKRDENARMAVRVAARILNCNFCSEDVLLTLTYSDEVHQQLFAGMEQDATLDRAKEELTKVLDRVRRKHRAKDMKVLSVTADMDGETGEVVRVHHHVVVTAAYADAMEQAWEKGLVHREHLYHQDDYTPLAVYLLGQVRNRVGKKKYSCTKNMTKPRVEEQVLDGMPTEEIRVQPGAKVLDRTPYRDGMPSQYVRYKRQPRQPKRGGHKEGLPGENETCGGTDQKGGSGFDFSKAAWG